MTQIAVMLIHERTCPGCLGGGTCWVCLGAGRILGRDGRRAGCHRCDGTGICGDAQVPRVDVPGQR